MSIDKLKQGSWSLLLNLLTSPLYSHRLRRMSRFFIFHFKQHNLDTSEHVLTPMVLNIYKVQGCSVSFKLRESRILTVWGDYISLYIVIRVFCTLIQLNRITSRIKQMPQCSYLMTYIITMSPVQFISEGADQDHSGMAVIHFSDVIMSEMASQITGISNVCSIVCSGVDQRKHQNSASLAFVMGIHRYLCLPFTKGEWRGKYFHLVT